MLRNAIFNTNVIFNGFLEMQFSITLPPPKFFLTNVIFNGFVVVQTLAAILIDPTGKISFWAISQPKFNLATIKLRLIKLVRLNKLG